MKSRGVASRARRLKIGLHKIILFNFPIGRKSRHNIIYFYVYRYPVISILILVLFLSNVRSMLSRNHV